MTSLSLPLPVRVPAPLRRLSRAASLAAALGLAGCATPVAGPGPQDTAFVVIGEDGAATARVITGGAACPPLTVDNRSLPMRVRVPRSSVPARPGQAAGPASAAVLTCEAPIAAGSAVARVGGRPLPVPRAQPGRIVVIGDTGCRIKGEQAQACNDPARFPFARVAAAAAAFKPDLVIHVGDYHYREDPCPAGQAGCAGSPYGYGFEAWAADFFTPGRTLFEAAPWVLARGNHENCTRAGQGWWRWLDPRPFQAGRDCDVPANDAVGDYGDPYAVPLGNGAQLVVFDTANTSWKGFAATDPRRAAYAGQYRKIEALARRARYNIGVGHHPLFAFGARRDANSGEVSLFGGDAGLLDAFGDVDPGYLPPSFGMLLSGHVHLWEQVSFASGHPTQFVAGFSGTAEDTAPLPAAPPPGRAPAPGAIVEHMSSWVGGFGFMTMERTGADAWRVSVRDLDGRERNSCKVEGRKSVCALAQVR
ncbi:metallophosphoesterase [Massilia jejuensis]|uniref:Metallophosphoesterase n=1 Tax=Massilia jejuensis TaxID=648894 RepID=A0ABW0PDZ0_9BURK